MIRLAEDAAPDTDLAALATFLEGLIESDPVAVERGRLIAERWNLSGIDFISDGPPPS